jgi:hypothetical protein
MRVTFYNLSIETRTNLLHTRIGNAVNRADGGCLTLGSFVSERCDLIDVLPRCKKVFYVSYIASRDCED